MPKFNWFTRKPKPTTQEKLREELRKWNEEGLGDTAEYDTVSRLPVTPTNDIGAIGDIDVVMFVKNTVPQKIARLRAQNSKLLAQVEKNEAELLKLHALQDAVDNL